MPPLCRYWWLKHLNPIFRPRCPKPNFPARSPSKQFGDAFKFIWDVFCIEMWKRENYCTIDKIQTFEFVFENIAMPLSDDNSPAPLPPYYYPTQTLLYKYWWRTAVSNSWTLLKHFWIFCNFEELVAFASPSGKNTCSKKMHPRRKSNHRVA